MQTTNRDVQIFHKTKHIENTCHPRKDAKTLNIVNMVDSCNVSDHQGHPDQTDSPLFEVSRYFFLVTSDNLNELYSYSNEI